MFRVAVICLLGVFSAFAHGDLHLQIVEITKEIDKSPKNAELFMHRADLHRAHGDWDAAQADYDHAFALDPKIPYIDLARARMFLEANWAMSCKTAVDRFLARNPDHPDGLIIRARALVKLGQRLDAAQDYTKSIAKTVDGKPELFLERAQALAAEGPSHVDEAIKGLDEGVQKLGPLVTLNLYAMAKAPRKETWLERRGNILRQAGKPAEARQAYEAALEAMKTLPPVRRNVPAMLELEKRLRGNIEALASAAKS